MLHLDAGVHLDEEELAAEHVEDELDGARIDVTEAALRARQIY
ncbi:MAG: hypothetical protein Q8Q26_09550 [Pseudorhodobacter sp.]|nr:hypothetical protein [Pseudorhodobacter sp.]